MLKVYENIRKRRKELGWTQEELAKKLGYSDKSGISKVERGAVDLPIDKFKEFARVLDITPAELLADDWKEQTLNEMLLKDFNQLNDEGKELAVNLVRGLVTSGQYKKPNSAGMVEEEA